MHQNWLLLLVLSVTVAPPVSAADDNLPTAINSTSKEHLPAWPPIPFTVPFGADAAHEIRFDTEKAIIPALDDTVIALLADELRVLESLSRRHHGPIFINVEGPGGMPWLGCTRDYISTRDISWRMGAAVDMLTALQRTFIEYGFMEVTFEVVDLRPGKGTVAQCVIAREKPRRSRLDGNPLDDSMGNRTVSTDQDAS